MNEFHSKWRKERVCETNIEELDESSSRHFADVVQALAGVVADPAVLWMRINKVQKRVKELSLIKDVEPGRQKT